MCANITHCRAVIQHIWITEYLNIWLSNISGRQQRDTTSARWPGCGAANTHSGEKSKQAVYKKLSLWEKTQKNQTKTQTKYFKKFFLAAPKKIRYGLWTAHQHIHDWNFKQLVFQTNNSISSTCASPKPSSLSTLTKSNTGRRIAVQTAYRTKAGDKTWTKALLILEICLRKLWVLANKHDFCLQS